LLMPGSSLKDMACEVRWEERGGGAGGRGFGEACAKRAEGRGQNSRAQDHEQPRRRRVPAGTRRGGYAPGYWLAPAWHARAGGTEDTAGVRAKVPMVAAGRDDPVTDPAALRGAAAMRGLHPGAREFRAEALYPCRQPTGPRLGPDGGPGHAGRPRCATIRRATGA
jgi:hypothetical protein